MHFHDSHDRLALLFAALTIVCLGIWPMFRSRAAMLLVQLAALSSVTIHYALMGAWTASAVNLLGAIQIAACLMLAERHRWLGYVLAGCMVVAGFATWEGGVSALATVGMILVAVGRTQAKADVMRVVVLSGGPFWLAHDLLLRSPIAIADALSLALGLWVLLASRRPRHVAASILPPPAASR